MKYLLTSCFRFLLVLIVSLFVFSISSEQVLAFSGAGAGTSGNPFQITTCTQLQEMEDDADAHYRLMNNIDCSATSSWNSGGGFDPIGHNIGVFSGTLDGQGFTISNLFINTSGRPAGLIGSLTGTVKNIGLIDVNITGLSFGNHADGVGSIAGVNVATGLIQNVYATGTVTDTGFGDAGGLVGVNNDSTIQNSYARVMVSGGGAGFAVTGTGGLVGYNSDGGAIQNSYSTGSVSVPDGLVGGLVGENDGGTVTNSFWDTQTSGQATSAGGTGKTTAQMKTLTTFSGASWDIQGNTNNLNNGYPFLSWQVGGSSPIWYIYDPTVSSSSNSSSSSSSGNSSSPSCTDSTPTSAPNLFQIDRTGTSATLYFSPVLGANNYYIAYGYTPGDQRFGVQYNGNSTGVISYTINQLSPNTTYYFQVRAGNGCAPGPWGNTMSIKTTGSTASDLPLPPNTGFGSAIR